MASRLRWLGASMNWQRFYSAASAFVAVTWFIALFFATIAIAVVTLSASQLQGRLAGISQQSEVPLSVWQIERIRNAWERQQGELNDHEKRLTEIETQIGEAQEAVAAAARVRDGLTKDYQRAEDDLVAKLANFEPLALNGIEEKSERERRSIIASVFQSLRPKLQPQTIEAIEAVERLYTQARRTMDAAAGEVAAREAAARQLEGRRADQQQILAQSEAAMGAIINVDGSLSPRQTTRIRDLMSEFDFLYTFAYGMFYSFSVLPNELLVMVLVIAMGTLGSTLQLTYDYYRQQRGPRTSHFLLIPMLGAITALVLFIVMRAGVMVITESSQSGEAVPLSPFFLGFLGIVAGFLSENTLETVRGLGQSWLKRSASEKEEEPALWGQGLEVYLGDDRKLETLANRTGVELAVLRRWFGGTERVPADMQRVISAWLDVDRAVLFSDQPPKAGWSVAVARKTEEEEQAKSA